MSTPKPAVLSYTEWLELFRPPGSRDDGELINCPACLGSGTQECFNCGGEMDCDECNGEKQLTFKELTKKKLVDTTFRSEYFLQLKKDQTLLAAWNERVRHE